MSSIYRSEDIAKFILRITVGLLILFHGIAKLINLQALDFIKNQLEGTGMHPIFAYGVYVGEIVAPLLIILGIYSRFGGFLIFVNMLFAIVLVHTNDLLSLTEHGGWRLELQALFLVGGLVIMLIGSGRYAIKPD
ncbi:MAG: DoxX family protein [Gammaproteobacteria bacterium]|nr:DoxX family protein [Gammaproteobacteria bacterium]